MADLIAVFIGLAVPAAAVAWLLVVLRRRRRYAFLRLVDGATNQPLAGAWVFGIPYSGSYAAVHDAHGVLVFAPTTAGPEQRCALGRLDASGQFQRRFGHRDYAALWIEAPGLAAGIVGIDAVADYDRFPEEPYVCTVTAGMIAPPQKRSNLVRGLAPGETVTRREGYTNRYERPEPHETVICYPTLEHAKRHAHGGGLDRYWKVEGVYLADYQDGYQLEVERVQPAR